MSHYLCDICLELLQNPVTTWCGHTFCMSHLLEWLKSHKDCPVCRAEVDKSRLCTNYKLKEAVEAFLAGQHQSVCSECEEATATSFCAECNIDLCDKCFKTVHSLKVFRSHVAIPLEKKHASLVPKCPSHPMKSFDLFCTSCSVALCSTCAFLGDHDQHKKKLLPFDQGRASIEQNINSINQELAVAIDKVSQSTQSTVEKVVEGCTQMKENLTCLLDSTMLDSATIMNNLKLGKPVVFKPTITDALVSCITNSIKQQTSVLTSLHEDLLSLYSTTSDRLTALSVDSTSVSSITESVADDVGVDCVTPIREKKPPLEDQSNISTPSDFPYVVAITGIPSNTSESSLKEFFEADYIVHDGFNNSWRVAFNSKDNYNDAFYFDDTQFEGAIIKVSSVSGHLWDRLL
ncbi:hypothetical protein GEMRC1_008656 [Eukaryota sp. GEM-RC1]